MGIVSKVLYSFWAFKIFHQEDRQFGKLEAL